MDPSDGVRTTPAHVEQLLNRVTSSGFLPLIYNFVSGRAKTYACVRAGLTRSKYDDDDDGLFLIGKWVSFLLPD